MHLLALRMPVVASLSTSFSILLIFALFVHVNHVLLTSLQLRWFVSQTRAFLLLAAKTIRSFPGLTSFTRTFVEPSPSNPSPLLQSRSAFVKR